MRKLRNVLELGIMKDSNLKGNHEGGYYGDCFPR